MSYSGGVLESSSNVFYNSTIKDFVFRTVDLSEKLILGNTACNKANAGLYVSQNAVGIQKLPGAGIVLDVTGFNVDTSANVHIANTLNVGTISVSGNILPTTDIAYDLGSSNYRFRDLHLSGSTVYFGNVAMANSNGSVQFIDPVSSNLQTVICGQMNIGNAAITTTSDGAIQFTGAGASAAVSMGLLSNIGYNGTNNYWGLGNSTPLGTLHFNNGSNATEMRMILTDKTTNPGASSTTNTVGYQFWKDSAGNGYLQNYFSGGSINIQTTGTQSTGSVPNINIGSLSSSGQVGIKSLGDAVATFQTASAASNAGVVFDAASVPTFTSGSFPGARKYYIRSTGNTAATSGGTSGNRAGLLEIGDLGGNSGDSDATARSNLIVLDKFSRMWVGRNIAPGTLSAGLVGTGTVNDVQPALVIVGTSNSTGIKPPLIHLARNSVAGDLTGFGIQLSDNSGINTLRIGRSDIRSNSGNPTYSNDITIDASGNVGVGKWGSLTDRFTVQDTGSATSNHSIIATNNGSYIGFQPLSIVASFNPMVAANDARIVFSSNNTVNYGALSIVPYASSRLGLRLTATGTHEMAGNLFMNGKLGIGNSSPAYDLDVTGRLHVTSNADMSLVNASNIVVAATTGSVSTTNLVSNGGVLNIGGDSNTSTVNIACSTASQVVNIGTVGVSNTVINIGGAGDIVNIIGSTNSVTANNTTSCNKTIDLNYGGAAGTGGSVGVNVNEGGSVTGYIRTSPDRNAWLIKAPNTTEARIDCTGGTISIGSLVMPTTGSCNVGIGSTSPQYKLDVAGTINATGYCNLQFSFLTGVPSLSAFSNDLSNFSRNVIFNGTITGSNASLSNITVVGTSTLETTTVTNLTGSNVTACNVTATSSLTTNQIGSVTFGSAITIGCDSNTSRLDIGLGSSTTLLNIGKNNDGTIINIGDINDIVNIPGTLLATLASVPPQGDGYYTYEDYGLGVATSNFQTTTTQLVAASLSVGTGISPLGPSTIVSDKFRVGLFNDPNLVTTFNKDSLASSGSNCGINIEENGVIDGWFMTTPDRNGWTLKAPGGGQTLVTSHGANFVSWNSNTMILIGDSNGTIGMGTNNPNTAYKLHVAGPLYANQYINLPIADVLGTSGTVSLCNAINSGSTTVAATAQAVQTAYNAAIGACNVATGRWIAVNATGTTQGIVSLVDATNSNTLTANSSYAASPAAVASTYAYASTKWSATSANSGTQGIIFLTDSTTCNVSGDVAPLAASAKAVYLANQNASSKWTASYASLSAPGYAFVSDATDCNRPWATTDSLYAGPIVASVKAVYDTMQLAITSSNKAYTTTYASASNTGSVLLSDSVVSSSNATKSMAASPYAVSQAYTLAQTANTLAGTKWSNLNATGIQQGTVFLSDSATSTVNASSATPTAASPYAVNVAYTLATTASNRAYAAWIAANATTAVPGIVYITDATNSGAGTGNSVPIVPTALALSNVANLAAIGSNKAFTHPTTVAASATLGHVTLSDSYTDTTDDVTKGIAATPKAVAYVYNTLTTATFSNIVTAQGTNTKGAVYLTDSTSCNVSQTSQPLAASAMAVYNAYQMAVAASNWASQRPNNIGTGSLTTQGALQLSDDTTNTSTSLAATIASVTRTYNYAVNSLQKAGGTMTGDITGTNVKVTGAFTSGMNGNFMQLWSDSAIIGKNTAAMRFGFCTDMYGNNWSEKMRIDTNGHLGVGTQSPTAPISVTALANGDPTNTGVYVYNPTTTNNAAHAIVTLRVNGATSGCPYISFDIAGVQGWSQGVDNSDGQKFKIATAWNNLSTNTRVTITPGGNVGINTITPSSILDVNGDTTVRGNLLLPNSPGVQCFIGPGTGDGASSSTYNLKIASWNGISFYDQCYNRNNIYFDCRAGNGTWTGAVTAGTITSTTGDVASAGLFKSFGNNGWYNQSWGGGWFMSDASWIRAYNNKNVYTAGVMCANVVGVNNVSPAYTLDVNGDIHSTGVVRSDNWQSPSWGGGWYMSDSTFLRIVNDKAIYSGGGNITTGGGYVGVGTYQPSWPLHVAIGTAIPNGVAGGGYYKNGDNKQESWGTGTGGINISIYAENGILTKGWFAFTSDIRTKNILAECETPTIDIINSIDVVWYEYKDQIVKGNGKKLGFIAQQLVQHLPEAVNFHTDFIPDIYKHTDKVNANTITLKDHGLSKGETIKLYDENDKAITAVIKCITSNDTFTFETKDTLEQDTLEKGLFVYGRQVEDVHTVNNDMITALAIHGVKELSKTMKLKDKEIAELKRKTAENEVVISSIQAEIADLKALVNKLIAAQA